MNKQAFTTLLGVAVIGLIVTTIATIALSFIISTPFWVFFFGVLFTSFAPLIILTIAWGQHDFEFDDNSNDFGAFKLFRKKSDVYPNGDGKPLEMMEDYK